MTVLACQAASVRADQPGEQARFTAYSIRNGLSQSSIPVLIQDHHGFLWVGTWDGLNRYDGYEFRVYRPDPEQPGSLSDGLITSLALAPNGGLWIGTRHGGLNYYHRRDDRFIAFTTSEGPARLPGNRVDAVLSASDGATWIGTDAGLVRMLGPIESPRTELVLRRRALVLAEDGQGSVWVGCDDGSLHRFRAGAVEEVPLGPDAQGAPIRAILADRPGETWVATHSTELFRIGPDDAVTRVRLDLRDRAEPGRIRSLARDPDDGLWVGGLGIGLVYLDAAGIPRRAFRHTPLDRNALSNDDILSLFVDRESTLWIGTLTGGLNRLPLGPTGFRHYWHRPDTPYSLNHNTVTAFARARDGTIFVGTDGGGVNALDPGTGRFTPVPLGRDGVEGLARVWALEVDRDDTLWAGTWGGGLLWRRTGEPDLEHVAGAPGEIVTSIVADATSLWVGSADAGLARLDSDGRLQAHYLPKTGDPGTLPDLHVTALLPGMDGVLWVGTWSGGLASLDPASGRFTSYRREPGAAGAPQDRIRALVLAGDGTLWLGTAAGLARFNHEVQQVEHLGEHHGLPAGTVYGIVEDRDQRLWLSTNSGIVRFDPAMLTTRQFTPEEGAQDFEFNGGAFLALPDGRSLFGGINGFNLVDPAVVRPATPPPNVVITDFLLFGRSVRPRHADGEIPVPVAASELESIELGHRFNMLAFRFAAPLPVAPRQNRYAYRLDGFDNDWRVAGTDDRLAAYTNLAPGRYRLRVRASGADGLWSPGERTVDLRILPPWWLSKPAFALYVVMALAAIAALVQWRTYALRRHAAVLHEQVRSRTRRLDEQKRLIEDQARHLAGALDTKEQLFARVSHEFRTPLTLILGPIETLLADERRGRTAQWLRLMRRNARRLLALVDELLGLSRLSGERPLSLSPQQVSPLLRGTVAAFGSLAARKRIRLEADPVEDGWVNASPELLERIVTNLVSNAIKYTSDGGSVQVASRVQGGMIQIIVKDDGPGIPLEDQAAVFEPFQRLAGDSAGSGIGLAVVRESALALGGSVSLDSGPGRGAEFMVSLPQCPAPRIETGLADKDWPQSERMLLAAESMAEDVRVSRAELLPGDGGPPAAGDDRPHVLIVEDSPDLRTLLLAALEPAWRCTEASDGHVGIAMAFEEIPDLVISDVMMPRVDGFDLTRILKSDARTSHVPVILLTALGDRSSRLQGLEEHADDYLVKPFDSEELRLRVRNLLEARQILRQRAGTQVYRDVAPLTGAGGAQPELHSPRERLFLERLQSTVEKRYMNPGTSTAEIAGAVAMSERQLQRKLRSLLNLSPGEYLREYRLQRAAAQLASGSPAGVVALDCGFSSQSYFGSCFKARFGVTPGEYCPG